ncbi:EcoRII N-terminal effector-binding domain-containing protein [Pseudomonas vlassakiae]|uniref:Restriction endonuclease n=1 Tax=Pseudomonas vlassakiae TaxID=485888 RepID=A0A923GLB3_9PSED|nr:EcoRII N-terminal effector-binding domain-containing protein [Pseudomonas vlassakiae]MBV4542144.1 restriction endonuclease [Pseudomonas vlassakiae]
MKTPVFRKTLSANDVGATGAHQAGILIPKSESDLLSILPSLDPAIKNPDAWIECEDEDGTMRKFRFVYYNNKIHKSGTRNEYRITHMTKYFNETGARQGESLEISKPENSSHYRIRIVRSATALEALDLESGVRIKIKSAWRRVH